MKRTLVILAIVFVGLLVLSQLTSRRRLATTEGGGFVEIIPTGIDTGEIESLRGWLGSAPDTLVELKRAGDGWVVASLYDWPVQENRVTQLLDDVAGLSGELRSSTEAVLPDYQIDDESGFHLIGGRAGGSEVFHIVIGKNSPRGGSFIRNAGSNDVYAASASFRSNFGLYGDDPGPPEGGRWADKQVLNVERNDVDKVVLTTPDDTIVLEKAFETPEEEGALPDRTQWTWIDDDRGEFDKAKADRVLNAICRLYAADIVDPAGIDTLGLGDTARVGEITLSNGTVERVRFGAQNEASQQVYFVKDGGMPATIHTSTVDRIFVARADLSPDVEEAVSEDSEN
jgi:hypothetical protein